MSFRFVVDTREKTPYILPNAIMKALATGDYSIEGWETVMAVERKGYDDLFTCLSSKLAAFRNQMVRLSAMKYRALTVDTTLSAMKLGHVFVPISGEDAIIRLMEMSVQYGVPVYFCDRNGATITKAFLYAAWKEEMKTCRPNKPTIEQGNLAVPCQDPDEPKTPETQMAEAETDLTIRNPTSQQIVNTPTKPQSDNPSSDNPSTDKEEKDVNSLSPNLLARLCNTEHAAASTCPSPRSSRPTDQDRPAASSSPSVTDAPALQSQESDLKP